MKNRSVLSEEQVASFVDLGYLIIPNAISEQTILKAREAYERMRKKCETGEYKLVKMDCDLDRKEFRGIDEIFNPEIFESEILEALQESNVLSYSKQILGEDDVSLVLNRLHCNRYYSYSGYWHRDGQVNIMSHIQSNLNFYDENGFYVIPRSHRSEEIQKDKLFSQYNGKRTRIKEQELIKVKAGDLLLFDSSIFHRGSCAGRIKYQRCHVHLRFAKTKELHNIIYSNEENWSHNSLQCAANEDWREIFTKARPLSKVEYKSTPRKFDTSLKPSIRRIKNKVAYYMSSLVPRNSSLFDERSRICPNPWVHPED